MRFRRPVRYGLGLQFHIARSERGRRRILDAGSVALIERHVQSLTQRLEPGTACICSRKIESR
jgi:hypothetical protein